MTHSPSTSRLGLAYNAFLFASIGDESSATPLNTVSVLARLDIDPWREAAELTSLTKDSAVQRLAALLARLPGRPYGLSDSESIAIRLVALLPGGTGPAFAASAQIKDRGAAANPILFTICFEFAIFIILSGFFQYDNAQNAVRTGVNDKLTSVERPLMASQPNIHR